MPLNTLFRAWLIRTGRLVPLSTRPTLRLDARGASAALHHMAQYFEDSGMQFRAFEPNFTPVWE